MAKPEWGSKHFCLNCAAKFYDMKRVPALCPACGTKVKSSDSPTTQDTAPTHTEASDPVKALTEGSTTSDTESTDIHEGTNDDEENQNSIAEFLEKEVAQED